MAGTPLPFSELVVQTSPPEYLSVAQLQAIATSSAERYHLTKIQTTKLLFIEQCESGFNVSAWNKDDPNGGSKGLFQFQQPTFDKYVLVLGIENPDIWNPEQQSQLSAYLISKGLSSLWTCARMYDKTYTK